MGSGFDGGAGPLRIDQNMGPIWLSPCDGNGLQDADTTKMVKMMRSRIL